MADVLLWVASVMCLPWLRDSEGGVGGNCGVLARVRWVACKRKWHAIISAIAIVEILS